MGVDTPLLVLEAAYIPDRFYHYLCQHAFKNDENQLQRILFKEFDYCSIGILLTIS